MGDGGDGIYLTGGGTPSGPAEALGLDPELLARSFQREKVEGGGIQRDPAAGGIKGVPPEARGPEPRIPPDIARLKAGQERAPVRVAEVDRSGGQSRPAPARAPRD